MSASRTKPQSSPTLSIPSTSTGKYYYQISVGYDKWLDHVKNDLLTKKINRNGKYKLGSVVDYDEGINYYATGVNLRVLIYVKDGQLHNPEGPAKVEFTVNDADVPLILYQQSFYLKGESVSEEVLLLRNTKLGDILYG
jgi:hypothetical protein